MKTKVFAVVVGLGVLASLPAGAAVPYFGSVFATNVTAGGIAAPAYTNVFWCTNGVTNLPWSGVAKAVEHSGSGDCAFVVDMVSQVAAGTTNNGYVTFAFARSLDGTNYLTASNGFLVTVPSLGSTRVVWTTNMPFSVAGGVTAGPFAYFKLSSVNNTNLAGYWVSNIWYRFMR